MLNRRLFLRGAAVLGCSAAAHPWLTTVTLAQGARRLGDHRLVVVILRGAMDGLDAVQPLAEPDFVRYRPNLARQGDALPLDNRFALHGKLGALMPLWQAGQLGFVHATSTPYRNKRSHFDGQDILEAGTGLDVPVPEVRDGWLNRMLQAVPGLQAETAYAIGREALPLLAGAAPARSWTPEVRLQLSAQSRLLLESVYHDDPLFRDAAQEAMELAAALDLDRAAQQMSGAAPGGMSAAPKPADKPAAAKRFADVDQLAGFAADRLQAEARIAAFSLAGWDTHRGQKGVLGGNLEKLARLVLQLQAGLGPVWGKTLVVAMTEFGRTVAENGTQGTDHGTGGAMLMAGGALRGGQIYGRWPGLSEADLYDRRDLMPTSDVRSWAAWAMRGMYGLDRAVLESAVFPGLDMGDDPRILL
ncbi:MAG: twin-arginine translocation pathway signal [Rhodobacteraceae bacterium GWE1_64_9]|nr:MAG: twin-arginine translocation pathway signal [Rhodobacteraceae bacterium GWE1_64_9]